MPTSSKARQKILEVIPKNINGPIYELGSGWGGLAMIIGKKCPDQKIVAIENFFIPYFINYIRVLMSGVKNISLKLKDFYNDPLNDAGLVICYLYPGAMIKLKEKFERELKPGTVVISNTFSVPEWEANQVYQVGDIHRSNIYVYKVDG